MTLAFLKKSKLRVFYIFNFPNETDYAKILPGSVYQNKTSLSITDLQNFAALKNFKMGLNFHCKSISMVGDPNFPFASNCFSSTAQDQRFITEIFKMLHFYECSEGCKVCNHETLCTECMQGYFLSKKRCLKCHSSCSDCINYSFNCLTTCSNGTNLPLTITLNSKDHKLCNDCSLPNCELCLFNNCFKCHADFTMINSRCLDCTEPYNAVDCGLPVPHPIDSKCNSDYFYDQAREICFPNDLCNLYPDKQDLCQSCKEASLSESKALQCLWKDEVNIRENDYSKLVKETITSREVLIRIVNESNLKSVKGLNFSYESVSKSILNEANGCRYYTNQSGVSVLKKGVDEISVSENQSIVKIPTNLEDVDYQNSNEEELGMNLKFAGPKFKQTKLVSKTVNTVNDKGTCLFCSLTFFKNVETGTCQSCPKDCIKCTSSLICTQCKSTFDLKMNSTKTQTECMQEKPKPNKVDHSQCEILSNKINEDLRSPNKLYPQAETTCLSLDCSKCTFCILKGIGICSNCPKCQGTPSFVVTSDLNQNIKIHSKGLMKLDEAIAPETHLNLDLVDSNILTKLKTYYNDQFLSENNNFVNWIFMNELFDSETETPNLPPQNLQPPNQKIKLNKHKTQNLKSEKQLSSQKMLNNNFICVLRVVKQNSKEPLILTISNKKIRIELKNYNALQISKRVTMEDLFYKAESIFQESVVKNQQVTNENNFAVCDSLHVYFAILKFGNVSKAYDYVFSNKLKVLVVDKIRCQSITSVQKTEQNIIDAGYTSSALVFGDFSIL